MHPIRSLVGLGALVGGAVMGVGAVGGVVGGALVADAPAQDAAFPWRTDLAAARAEAQESGKPLFVSFR